MTTMQKNIFTTLFCLAICLLTVNFASGSAIQERMKERIPALTDLKNAGTIGENNMGYLEFLGDGKDQQELVDAENSDRKKVYTVIGRKQQVDAEVVGIRRAKQIYEIGIEGHWFQNEAGEWVQK